MLGSAQDVLLSSLAGQYPPRGVYSENREAWKIADLGDAIKWLEMELSELERRLSTPAAVLPAEEKSQEPLIRHSLFPVQASHPGKAAGKCPTVPIVLDHDLNGVQVTGFVLV